MGNKKVLSIEIGNRLTQIAEVDYRAKKPKIYCNFVMETPEGVMNDGVLKITPEYVKKIKSRILQSRMKSRQVIFTISSVKSIDRESVLPMYEELAAELGVTMAAIEQNGNCLYQMEKTGKQETKDKGFLEVYSSRMLIGFIAASVIVLVLGIVPYYTERAINISKTKQVSEYEELMNTYRRYAEVKEDADYLDAVYEYTVLPTETFVDLIEEMERSMSEGMRVTSFNANKTGVSFTMITETKQQAADILLKLREMESLKNITMTEIRNFGKKTDGGNVQFSVTADYVNGKTDVMEEETASEAAEVAE